MGVVTEIKKANGEVMRIIDGEYVIGASSGCFSSPNPHLYTEIINGEYLVEKEYNELNSSSNPCGDGRHSNFNGFDYGLIPVFTYCSYCGKCDIRTTIFDKKYYDQAVEAGVVFNEEWDGVKTYTASYKYKPIWNEYRKKISVVTCNYYRTKSDELIGLHTCWENLIIWVKGQNNAN
jgi:hypothetical protein